MRIPRTPLLLALAAVSVPLALSSTTGYAAAGDVWAVTKEASGTATAPSVTDAGTRVAFGSTAATLKAGDTNGLADVFYRQRDGYTKKLSSRWRGGDADGASGEAGITAGGGLTVLSTTASNLWNSDHNARRDIYVCRSSSCNTVGWVRKGIEPNGHSLQPRISADGQWVVFASDADNWVAGDTNGKRDVFLAHLRSGNVTRLSVTSSGEQLRRASDHPAISADGRYVTFTTGAAAVAKDRNGLRDVYLRDVSARRTYLASQGREEQVADGASTTSAVARRCNDDGRCFPTVVFTSKATNLTAGDTNAAPDVFVREGGSTARISVATDGTQGARGEASWAPSISSDGRRVVFATAADLTGVPSSVSQVILRDREDGSMHLVSQLADRPGNRDSDKPSISANGRYVAFLSRATNLDSVPADNGTWDVFVSQVY